MTRLALLLVHWLVVVTVTFAAEPKKYALLVGVNKYEHTDLSPLEYAEADVRDLKRLLDRGGYQTVLLAGKDATLAKIRKELDTLRKDARGAAVVLVALAGHGIQQENEKEAYFCPVDASQEIVDRDGKKVADWDLKKSMLPISEVIAQLKGSGAKSKALLVDACRNDPKTGRGRGFATNFNIGDLPDNLAVLLSCSRGEKAWEDATWGHGAFFYHVLQGLSGKAAIDGYVSANTLAGYVKRAVKNDVTKVVGGGAAQNPHTIVNGDVDFLIALDAGPEPEPMASGKEPRPGEERDFDVGNGVKMRFCWIPGSKGKFTIGSPKAEQDYLVETYLDRNRPVWLDYENEHEVAGVDGFWMAKYEMTQVQYVKLTGLKNPSYFCSDGGGKDRVAGMSTDDFPVEQVSWEDAQACIKKMKVPAGMKKISLPSEVQWEWATRGGKGNGQAFYWGDELNGDKANCNGEYPYGTTTKGPYLGRTTKVGSYESKALHPWGLCDMAGNVWEWCEDYYGPYDKLPGFKNSVQTVKQSDDRRVFNQSDDRRVLRGGSWFNITRSCRCALRNNNAPDDRYNDDGFRVVVLP